MLVMLLNLIIKELALSTFEFGYTKMIGALIM